MKNNLLATTVVIIYQSHLHAQDIQSDLTLKQITAEQDWIARSPQYPRWLLDGSAIRYSQRRQGSMARDFSDQYLIRIAELDSEPIKITPQNPGPYFINNGDWNGAGTQCLISNSGDLFLFNAEDGSKTQLTQTTATESSVFYLADESGYAFSRSGQWVVRLFDSHFERQAADIKFQDEPVDDDERKLDDLEQQQRDLFEIIRLQDDRRDLRTADAKNWRDTNPTAVSGPYYLGKDKRSMGSWLSPSGKHMIVLTAPAKRANDTRDSMPNYVTADGYVDSKSVRPKVGLSTETPIQVVMLDLENEEILEISLDGLPTIKDDPLAWLKETDREGTEDTVEEDDSEDGTVSGSDSADQKPDESNDQRKNRPVSSLGVRWDDSGTTAAVMLLSHDNKDRWIVLLDTTQERLEPVVAHHLCDEAWIGWGFNSFGFIPNTNTLWYLSEETGYGHLYTRAADGTNSQVTNGAYEIRSIRFTRDGKQAYVRTNRKHPGIQEIERIDMRTAQMSPLTMMEGTVESFRLSPDEQKILFLYSNINLPPELYLMDSKLGSDPVRLTNTITQEFLDCEFQTPEIVPIPSSHTEHPIYTRLYLPDQGVFTGPRPIVLFSHGAGYLQHANYQWSNYSHEHMYHNLLTDRGFIVIAPDFRASSGYGRDWRTAIYRKMGYPELEDFQDTINYVIENHKGDPENVGIYGGSYGGFMTLMAMFLEPDTYKAGAALRSVTDWMHYNHGYTSNILNTPDIDPEPFKASSPIYHAEGLEGYLLMLHGMQDDNVVAQDIIRLSQRLIELEKENWELALHPIEPHGYREPSSWLDQMRRIDRLFITTLLKEKTTEN
ncbi:MAG: S9 family peptidase [Phycisphaerales bacterium]|nr:S9 family peptidase [Phycisphaerales bacterium]